jgi:hypothetical protein
MMPADFRPREPRRLPWIGRRWGQRLDEPCPVYIAGGELRRAPVDDEDTPLRWVQVCHSCGWHITDHEAILVEVYHPALPGVTSTHVSPRLTAYRGV